MNPTSEALEEQIEVAKAAVAATEGAVPTTNPDGLPTYNTKPLAELHTADGEPVTVVEEDTEPHQQ